MQPICKASSCAGDKTVSAPSAAAGLPNLTNISDRIVRNLGVNAPLEINRDCKYSNVRTSLAFSKSRKRETRSPLSGSRIDEEVFKAAGAGDCVVAGACEGTDVAGIVVEVAGAVFEVDGVSEAGGA